MRSTVSVTAAVFVLVGMRDSGARLIAADAKVTAFAEAVAALAATDAADSAAVTALAAATAADSAATMRASMSAEVGTVDEVPDLRALFVVDLVDPLGPVGRSSSRVGTIVSKCDWSL